MSLEDKLKLIKKEITYTQEAYFLANCASGMCLGYNIEHPFVGLIAGAVYGIVGCYYIK